MLTGYTTGSSKLVGMGELASPRISPRASEARASSRFATCPEDLERVKRVELPLQPWPGCVLLLHHTRKLASASDLASDRACLKGRALELALHSRTEIGTPCWYRANVYRLSTDRSALELTGQ